MIKTIVARKDVDNFLKELFSKSSISKFSIEPADQRPTDQVNFIECLDHILYEIDQDIFVLSVDKPPLLTVTTIRHLTTTGTYYDNKGFINKCSKLYPKQENRNKPKATKENVAKIVQSWHKNPDKHLYQSVSEALDDLDWTLR